jgi:hypothetical protein
VPLGTLDPLVRMLQEKASGRDLPDYLVLLDTYAAPA